MFEVAGLLIQFLLLEPEAAQYADPLKQCCDEPCDGVARVRGGNPGPFEAADRNVIKGVQRGGADPRTDCAGPGGIQRFRDLVGRGIRVQLEIEDGADVEDQVRVSRRHNDAPPILSRTAPGARPC